MARPANATAKPDGRRALAGVSHPANVSSADAEQFSESVGVDHDGRRCRPTATGVQAGGVVVS
jgi:hypothetical protein